MESGRPGKAFYLSPHPDDWILFRGEHASADLAAGRAVLILVTAGDAGLVSGFWEAREEAALSAIRAGAASPSMTSGTVEVRGHAIVRHAFGGGAAYCLRLPDGLLGDLRSSPLRAVDGSASYDSPEDLSETLEAIVRSECQAEDGVRPWIHAPLYRSDPVGSVAEPVNPHDHPDHSATGEAVRRFAGAIGHRAWWWSYAITGRPWPIEDPARLAAKRALFDAYKATMEARFEARGRPDDWARWVAGIETEWTLWGENSHADTARFGEPDPP